MWRIGWAPNSIPIYSYIQQDATLRSLFIFGNCSTCFGWYFHPSSGAHTTVSTDTVICAPDDRWKYHPKHVEQFPDINKLCNVASCWIYEYIGILLGAHPILYISRIRVNVGEEQTSSAGLHNSCASMGKYFVHTVMDVYEIKWVVMFLEAQLILLLSTVRI